MYSPSPPIISSTTSPSKPSINQSTPYQYMQIRARGKTSIPPTNGSTLHKQFYMPHTLSTQQLPGTLSLTPGHETSGNPHARTHVYSLPYRVPQKKAEPATCSSLWGTIERKTSIVITELLCNLLIIAKLSPQAKFSPHPTNRLNDERDSG
jgi:hypothetical protein